MKKTAPIALFAYNRPSHLREVLAALKTNKLAEKSVIYIYCDGPKESAGESDLVAIREVRKIVKNFDWPGEKKVVEQNKNIGLSQSIISGVSEVINKYGKIIVLEDDIVASKYFLKYMNDALALHAESSNVISIGSYNYFFKSTEKKTFLIPIPDCWGWATWKNRWELFEKDSTKLINQIEDRGIQKEFDLNGNAPFFQMLKNQRDHKIDSWAIRWQATAYLYEKLTLYPHQSLTKNIGFDGSGSHTTETDKQYKPTEFSDEKIVVNNIPLKMDEKAYSQLVEFYSKNAKKRGKNMLNKLRQAINLIKGINSKNKEDSDKLYWSGNYSSWSEARNDSVGYDDLKILEKVRRGVQKVLDGHAAFERDSVVFDKLQLVWPVVACLQKIALSEEKLSVVDFGGSLGSTYLQHRSFMEKIKLDWSIIEQRHFVDAGNEMHAKDSNLNFYAAFEDIENKPNVLLLSGVLQVLEEPNTWISRFKNWGVKYILIDRTAFIERVGTRLTVQHVPDYIYKASYPSWFFNEAELINLFKDQYEILIDFPSHEGFRIDLNDSSGFYKGFLLQRKDV